MFIHRILTVLILLIQFVCGMNLILSKFFQKNIITINDFLRPFTFPDKKADLITYTVSIFLGIILILVIPELSKFFKKKSTDIIPHKIDYAISFVFIVLMFLTYSIRFLGFREIAQVMLILTYLYCSGALGKERIKRSFSYCKDLVFFKESWLNQNSQSLGRAYVGIILCLSIYVFGSFIIPTPYLMNEDMSLPAAHDNGVLHGLDSLNSDVFLYPNEEAFKEYCVDIEPYQKYFHDVSRETKYAFFLNKNLLCPTNSRTDSFNYVLLTRFMNTFAGKESLFLNKVEELSQKDFLRRSRMVDNDLSMPDISEKRENLNPKHHFSFHWKVLDRWMIHHHNFIIDPINRYLLGAKDIFSQYGKGFVYFLGNVFKTLGGINYSTYFKVFYSFFVLYFVSIFFWGRKIFGNLFIPSLICGFSLIAYLKIGYYFLMLGPGINPFRHLLDFALLYVLVKYFTSSENLKNLSLVVILTLVSIFINKDLGLVLILSVWGTILFEACLDFKNKKKLFQTMTLFALFISGFIFLELVTPMIKNTYSKYYIEGLAGFKLSSGQILLSAFFAILPLALNVQFRNKLRNPGIFWVINFWSIYCMGVMIYYVWSGLSDHFYIIAPIWVINVFLLLWGFNFNIQKNIRTYFFLSTISLIILLPLTAKFTFNQFRFYKQIYDNGKVTFWNFPNAQFYSNIPQEPFEESIKLINKYSDSNEISIISRYDNFLPFLAGKYSTLNVPELSVFLFSDVEKKYFLQKIKDSNKKYLFVDSKVEESPYVDIVHPFFTRWHDDSLWRAMRIEYMNNMFLKIKDQYELAEKGLLINVWRRKT